MKPSAYLLMIGLMIGLLLIFAGYKANEGWDFQSRSLQPNESEMTTDSVTFRGAINQEDDEPIALTIDPDKEQPSEEEVAAEENPGDPIISVRIQNLGEPLDPDAPQDIGKYDFSASRSSELGEYIDPDAELYDLIQNLEVQNLGEPLDPDKKQNGQILSAEVLYLGELLDPDDERWEYFVDGEEAVIDLGELLEP